jgi:hypothetical protein
MSELCGFCQGKPVLNAAAWTTWGAPHYVPCPRCGELNLPDDVERRATHDDGMRQARERFERDAQLRREWGAA